MKFKGKARSVAVETGLTFDNKVQIVKGLKAGDQVIIAGQQQVKDGSPVKEDP